MNRTDPMGTKWYQIPGIQGGWMWIQEAGEPEFPFATDGTPVVPLPAGLKDPNNYEYGKTVIFNDSETGKQWDQLLVKVAALKKQWANESATRAEALLNDPTIASNFYRQLGTAFKAEMNTPEAKVMRQTAYALWKITPAFDMAVGNIEEKLDPGEEGFSKAAGPTGTALEFFLNPRKALVKELENEGKKLVTKALRKPLTTAEKDALRDAARGLWQATSGRRAIWDKLRVHHRIPLEWAHVMPGDPNRLANLVGVSEATHKSINAAWAAFKEELKDAMPTPSQIMKKALEIDEKYGPEMIFPK